MASLALGAAGALVGSFFGPLGASIGWAIGSAAGSALFAKGQDGPRLTDLKLQNSSYGQMIPLTYGTVRITGNVVWQTDLQEHQQKTGGKGGPTVTTYTYSASFAVAICEGPILGVLRIWADSRLVYDPASITNLGDFPFTLYTGTETQLADPTIESVEGAGNVNGMRGVAYVVFTDKFLTDFGNRIPSLSFEVFTSSQPIPWRYASFTAPNSSSRAGNGGSGPQSGAIEGGRLIVSTVAGTVSSNIIPQPCGFSLDAYDLATGAFIENILSVPAPPANGGVTTKSIILQCQNNPHIMVATHSERFSGDIINAFYYDGAITCEGLSGNDFFAVASMPHFGNDAVYACSGNASAGISKWSAPGGAVLNPSPIAGAALGAAPGGAYSIAIDNTNGDVWAAREHRTGSTANELFRFDKDLNLIAAWPLSDVPSIATFYTGGLYILEFTVYNKILCINSPYSAGAQCRTWSVNDDNTFTVMTHDGSLPGEQTDSGHYPLLGNIISLGNGLLYNGDGIISLNQRAAAAILSDIVSDLSVRAGLTTAQINVSELIDLVDGYVISQQSAIRSMVEPLQTAYFFDAVESDTIAKFVKRGKDTEATIPLADLGTHDRGTTPPPLVTSTRMQEVDLPRSISAVYLNEGADYQNGTQQSQRLITSSELTISLQLAIVMDDTKAKQITDALLYNAWLEREKITILTPRKWTYLEPTDVIMAAGYRVRITDKGETTAGVVRFDGVVTAPYVFSQSAVAVPGLAPPPAPPGTPSLTDLLMLDIPLVTDGDYPNGYYAAMAGHNAGSWPGATLFKSIDGGVNFDSLLVDVVPDIIGVSTSVVGNYGGGNTFDELNSFGVQLTAGAAALASASALDVLNGANECLLGNEIIQFKTATLTGTGAYTLSGLLRGRRGTEWATATHGPGERFVMLPTSTNVNGPFAEIFAPRDFKAVTSGSALSSATDVPFTNNGIALRCYSPTGIGGGLNAAGDLAIDWIRRTRIGGTWQNFVDVPISEAAESYVVQIWDATFSVCARVITGITTPTVTYTAAQQVTDFGAVQQIIYVTVGQIGTIGLGVQQGAALTGAGASIDAPLNPVPPYNSGPPVPPPSGGCTGTVFNDTMAFAVGLTFVNSPSGFGIGGNWVLKLTTPASGDYLGQIDFFEFGGPPCLKTGVLSTGACGAPLIANAQGTGVEVPLYFTVGRPFYPGIYAHLEFATDYYFSYQTACNGATAVEMHIFNN